MVGLERGSSRRRGDRARGHPLAQQLAQEHLLVGLAHPSSDIVLYDYQANKLVKIVPGIPWKLGNPLSREIIVAPSGNIYIYRARKP